MGVVEVIEDWFAVRKAKNKLLATCKETIDRYPHMVVNVDKTDFSKTRRLDQYEIREAQIRIKAAELLCNEHRQYCILRFGDGISIGRTDRAEKIDPFFLNKNLEGGTLQLGGDANVDKDLAEMRANTVKKD